MDHLTPRKLAEQLGSARRGTDYHIAMNRSGWALVFLVPIMICILARTLGLDYDGVRATFANPFVAIVTGLFLLVGMRHFARGVVNIVDDYNTGATRAALIMLANGIAYLTIAAGILALARLAL